MTPLSICSAIVKAQNTEPPLLIPAKTPSSFAKRWVVTLASSSVTSITISTRFDRKI